MKILEKAHEELKQYHDNIFVNDKNLRGIKHQEYSLEEYINTDKKSFSYIYFDDYEQIEKCIHKDIQSLLVGRRHFVCKYLMDFLAENTQENFNEILKNTYLFALSYLIDYERGKNNIYDRFICPIFFASVGFFSKKEQYMMFKILNHNMSKNLGVMLSADGRNTIFPLAYHLAKDYIENTHDFYELAFRRKVRNQKLEFNSLYSKVYGTYLSNDDTITTNLFTALCDYHILKSVNDSNGYFEFRGDTVGKLFPWEIIALIRLRIKHNLNIDCIQHHLIDEYIPFLKEPDIEFINDNIMAIRNKVYADYNIVQEE